MLRKIIAIFCLLSLSLGSIAQQQKSDLRAIKVGLLTERMKLSSQQSEKFWPVYNRYEAEMKVVWRAMRELREKGAEHSNSKQAVDQLQKLEEQRVQIRGKYKDAFLKVISADQLAAMYNAESEFKKMLLERLKQDNKK